MYFITTKRMLEVCFSAHPNIQYRTEMFIKASWRRRMNVSFLRYCAIKAYTALNAAAWIQAWPCVRPR